MTEGFAKTRNANGSVVRVKGKVLTESGLVEATEDDSFLPYHSDPDVLSALIDLNGKITQLLTALGTPATEAGQSSIITALAGLHTDLATTLAPYLDGLEGLIGTSNTALASILTSLSSTIAGYVDGLEALTTSSNTKLDTLHTDIATTLAGLVTTLNGYVDGLEALSAGALAAGENHVGQVGGDTGVQTVTPTVDAAAYADGDSMFALQAVTVARVAAGSGRLTRLRCRSLTVLGAQMFVHVFSANPSASTFTKNGAMVLDAADRDKLIKTFALPVASWVAPKGVSPFYSYELIGNSSDLATLGYDLASGTDIYLAMEADGTHTPGSTTDLSFLLESENN